MKLLILLSLLIAFNTQAYDDYEDDYGDDYDYGTYEEEGPGAEEVMEEPEILESPKEIEKPQEKAVKTYPTSKPAQKKKVEKKKLRKSKSGTREIKYRRQKPANLDAEWKKIQDHKNPPKQPTQKRPRRKRKNSGERI